MLLPSLKYVLTNAKITDILVQAFLQIKQAFICVITVLHLHRSGHIEGAANAMKRLQSLQCQPPGCLKGSNIVTETDSVGNSWKY